MRKELFYCGYLLVFAIYLHLIGKVGAYTLLSQLPWFFFNTAGLIWLVKKHLKLEGK